MPDLTISGHAKLVATQPQDADGLGSDLPLSGCEAFFQPTNLAAACAVKTRMNRLILLLLLTPATAMADGWQCWQDAAVRYSLPVDLLYAVARVESGNNGKVVSKLNTNGSYDIGLMQINSMHLPLLRNYGITEAQLVANPCLNLHVGAWIMARSIARHGYNWRGIGAYNAGMDSKRAAYTQKVITMLNRIGNERTGLSSATRGSHKE